MSSAREWLLTPITMPTEAVPLPEWGADASVTVRGMNAKEKGAFEMQFVKKGEHDIAKQRQMRERMIVACCIDEAGQRLFTLDDIPTLGLQAVSILDRIYEACARVNGKGDSESVEKNSGPTEDA